MNVAHWCVISPCYHFVQVESCQEAVSVVVAGHGREVAVFVLQYNFTTSTHSFVMVRLLQRKGFVGLTVQISCTSHLFIVLMPHR